MKFYTIKKIKQEVSKPVERIAIVALAALGIAILAFFIALAKADGVS